MVNLVANADWLLFVVAVCAAQGGIATYLRTRGVPVRAHTWALLAVVLVGALPFVRAAGERQEQRLASELLAHARTYAGEVTFLGHAALPAAPAPTDPAYLALVEAELRWLHANPVVADVYTMRRRPDGAVYLLVDSETDYDHDGRYTGDREARTVPGEVYEDPDPELLQAFGGTETFSLPYTDRWGTWVSANVPLRGPDGAVEGVLGVDYPAERWLAEVADARLLVIGLAAIVALVAMGAAAASAISDARVAESARFLADMEASRKELVALNLQLRALSLVDGLTGVENRRAFDEALSVEVATAERTGSPLSLLLIDVDHFKSFNDVFGHPAGDDALKAVAALLHGIARKKDLVARYGGEEFVVVLAGVGADEALVAAERYRAAVEAAPWAHRPVTVSVGVASFSPGMDIATLVGAADAALYRAKGAGRNRVAGPAEDKIA